MHTRTQRAFAVLFGLSLLLPAQSLLAHSEGRNGLQERIEERRARAAERLAERRERLEARIEEHRVRIEERVTRIEERICDRLERLEERTGVDITLPAFCTGGGGGGGGDGEDEKPDLTLNASPMTISAGATSTLSWDSTRADACFASGGWSGTRPVDGTAEVSPTATTTYTLTCGNEAGSTTKSVSVGVGPGGSTTTPSVDLSAASSTILAGASTTLSWMSTNADTCQASGGWSGVRATSGSQSVAPNATTTYTLACGNGTATATDSVTVGVRATTSAPLPTVDLSANPLAIVQVGTSTLSWITTNADTCLASAGWSGSRATSGVLEIVPTATTTYTLACSNAAGTATDTVEVAVFPSAPALNKVVISEFVFNPEGSEPAEEWVELYNGTGASVDLMNWTIGDASSTDLIATTSRMLPVGGYLIITSSSSLAGTLNGAGIAAIAATSSIGANGLGNTGDHIRLGNSSGAEVDAVSYGTNTSALSPSVSIGSADEGNSVARVPVTTDTDTAADWTILATPTPGS